MEITQKGKKMSETIKSSWLDKNIINIDYNDPLSANSLTPEVLNKIFELIKKNNPKALIFTSSHPRVFCSGGNLKKYASMSDSQSRELNQQMRVLLENFKQLPVYTVAYIQGDCFGGGLEFLSCFDELVAIPYTVFGFWQKKQALSFGWGGFERLSHRLPPKVLVKLLQNAEILTASRAFKLGLIDSIETDFTQVLNSINFCIQTNNFKEIKQLNINNEKEIFEKLWFSEDHLKKIHKHKVKN